MQKQSKPNGSDAPFCNFTYIVLFLVNVEASGISLVKVCCVLMKVH